MRGVFEVLVVVVGAAMASDIGLPVEQANGGGRGHQPRVRHQIVNPHPSGLLGRFIREFAR